MTETERLEKNAKIKASRLATKARRFNQTCHVYKIKIDESQLSSKQKECLKMIFVEAKWIYNAILNFSKTNKVEDWDRYVKTVSVKNKDGKFEDKELQYIGSQMKKAVKDQILSSIKTLATLKKKGYQEPGKLKFVSDYKSLNLDQYGVTYSIETLRQIRIQRVPGRIHVNGLDQFFFDRNIEIANAKLLNTPLGYYLAITVYKQKEVNEEQTYLPPIGIDMGIKTSITTSEGELIDAMIEETERLKKLQRKLSRQQKGSNNYRKTQKLLERGYQKLSNRKDDIANKVVAKLLKHSKVCMQDELLKRWHSEGFGKQVQHSILGRVKAKLIRKERVFVLDSRVPTTKYCPNCKQLNKVITLADRMFSCPHCGYEKNRDIHSACNMIVMVEEGYPLKNNINKAANMKLAALYKTIVRLEGTELTPVETGTSTYESIAKRDDNRASSVAEAGWD